MIRFLNRYLLCLALFNLAACSSMQTVNVEQAMRNQSARGVDYGSLVEVVTLDGRKAKFRVVDMNEQGLGGKPGFFRYEEMRSLRVENDAGGSGETWAYVLGALGVVALIALIANADSVAVCANTPCLSPDPER